MQLHQLFINLQILINWDTYKIDINVESISGLDSYIAISNLLKFQYYC